MADYTFEIECDLRSALQADAAIKYLAGSTRLRIDGFFNGTGQWWALTKPNPLFPSQGVVAISGNTATLQDLKKNDLAILKNFSYDVISGPIELRAAFAAQAKAWKVLPDKQGKWTTRRHAYDPGSDGVGFVDDRGVQVLDRFENGVLRPKTLDPHPILHEAQKAAKTWILSGLRERWDESAFRQGGEWDAQRLNTPWYDWVRGVYTFEDRFIDYATILIGIYFAGAGQPISDCLTMQNNVAKHTTYSPWIRKDQAYTSLPVRNVANTNIGFGLVNLGRIS